MSALQVGWTSIANLALARISERQINSIEQDDEITERIRSFMVECALQVLEEQDWSSATHRVILPSMPEEPIGNFSRQFKLPNNFVRVIEVIPYDSQTSGRRSFGELQKHETWAAENGVLLVGNRTIFSSGSTDSVSLVYVGYSATDINRWSALLRDAVSCKIAMRLATNVKGGVSLANQIGGEYEVILGKARMADVYRQGSDLHVYGQDDPQERGHATRVRDLVR